MKILVLTDERVGSSKQSIALAEELSSDIITKNIKYNSLIKIPNCIRPFLVGYNIDKQEINKIIDGKPDIIVFSGRRLTNLALYLKRKLNKKAKLICILNPECSYKKIDIIIIPKHDNVKKQDNIIEIEGSLCKNDYNKIDSDFEKFKTQIKNFNTPFISLIIGGDTAGTKYDPIKFGEFIKSVSNIIKNMGGSLLITTSRRTSDLCVESMKENLKCKHYLYDWKNKTSDLNPYYAFMKLSDIVIMTGDSISMISEALTLNKSVYVYKPEGSLKKKHKQFCKSLLHLNLIKEYNINTKNLEKFNYLYFNELKRIIKIILTKIKEK